MESSVTAGSPSKVEDKESDNSPTTEVTLGIEVALRDLATSPFHAKAEETDTRSLSPSSHRSKEQLKVEEKESDISPTTEASPDIEVVSRDLATSPAHAKAEETDTRSLSPSSHRSKEQLKVEEKESDISLTTEVTPSIEVAFRSLATSPFHAKAEETDTRSLSPSSHRSKEQLKVEEKESDISPTTEVTRGTEVAFRGFATSPFHVKAEETDTRSLSPSSHRSKEQLAAEKALEDRCKSHNLRVRVMLYVLLIIFTLTVLGNMAISIISLFIPIPYWTAVRVTSTLQIICLIVARLVMLVMTMFTTAVFLGSMLWYKDEPTLNLAHFMHPDDFPTVDLFLPRYKEDWELFRPTIEAALLLDYPKSKLMIYILDDGSRIKPVWEHVEPMIQQHSNLSYITRPDGKDAKAGNLNNGLRQSSGTLISVIDADHRCHPDFLLRVIPHLLSIVDGHRMPSLDDITAFVQTTQVFYNRDLPLVRLLDGSHDLFYKLMLPSYNGMGCAPCVGTGHVMQRRALDDIGGGFITDCAVEDVTTSLAMHKQGWRSKYLNCCLIEGLSPETLSEFFTQRERWVAGSAQMLLYRIALLSNDLPLTWRMAYMVGSWYWILMLLFMIAIVVRMGLWFVFHTVSGDPTTTWVPLLSEYIPIYAMFFLLPILSIETKIASLVAVFTFVPTYLSVFWGWLRGRLNPKHHTYRVKGSAEAFGDSWPILANWNLAFLALVTVTFVVSTIPSLHMYHKAMDWVVPSIFVLWSYIVNFPIVYAGVRYIFIYAPRGLSRLASLLSSKLACLRPIADPEIPV